jgi:hypothetical protein
MNAQDKSPHLFKTCEVKDTISKTSLAWQDDADLEPWLGLGIEPRPRPVEACSRPCSPGKDSCSGATYPPSIPLNEINSLLTMLTLHTTHLTKASCKVQPTYQPYSTCAVSIIVTSSVATAQATFFGILCNTLHKVMKICM